MNASVPRHDSLTQEWSPPLPAAEGFAHTIVETPGIRSHVATIGSGDPVVMLHGFPQHWWEWRDVGPNIASRGYHVICPDLRGEGWTEVDDPAMRRTSILHDLVATLDALGVARVHLVSHDLGAVVASQFAYAYPERVRTMVQLSVPPSFMAFTPALLPAFAHMPPLLMHREGRSLRWLFGPKYLAKPMSEATIDGYLRVESRPGFHRAVRSLYRGMIIPEVARLASGRYQRMRLEPPALSVFGRKDGPFTEDRVRHICRDHDRHAAHFELAFIDDAAHFIVDDAPDQVAELVGAWIDSEGRMGIT